MVLKSAFVAAVCTGVLAISGPAMADQYRPAEFLNLELPNAVFPSNRIGPEARFAPVRIEAKSDEVQSEPSDADLEASVWPKLPPRKPHVVKSSVNPMLKRRAPNPNAPPRTPTRARNSQSVT